MSLLPLSLWCWQDAVKAIFQGKVTVVDTYPDVFIRAVNIDMPLPSVIALNEYVPKKDQTPAFTRRNVFLRDGYRCQYCNQYFRTNDLTLDHFVPRSMGGRLKLAECCVELSQVQRPEGIGPSQEIAIHRNASSAGASCPNPVGIGVNGGKDGAQEGSCHVAALSRCDCG